jgi:spoIIIJ-associated protein
MDAKSIEEGKQWLEELLRLSKIPAQVIATVQDGSCWLTIDQTQLTEEQIASLLGTNGAVIDAVQYLLNTVLHIEHLDEEHAPYTVELNGYRLRRQQELMLMAEYAAKQVRLTGQECALSPALSAAERRQIHAFLQDCDDLETHSRGQEPERHLVIKLKN